TGPDAPEVRDLAMRTDRLLGGLMELIDQKVGRGKALFVLSADHGVAPDPEVQERRKMPGGYIWVDIVDLLRSAFTKSFGTGELILGSVDNMIYFDYKEMAKKKLAVADLTRVAEAALLGVSQAHVARVLAREQIQNGVAGDAIARAAVNGFYPARS